MKRILIVLVFLLAGGCSTLDLVGTAADVVLPNKNKPSIEATVQLAKNAEANKIKADVQTENRTDMQAEAIEYNASPPWYVYVLVILALLISSPLDKWFKRRG